VNDLLRDSASDGSYGMKLPSDTAQFVPSDLVKFLASLLFAMFES
jgi:hypothetical protein